MVLFSKEKKKKKKKKEEKEGNKFYYLPLSFLPCDDALVSLGPAEKENFERSANGEDATCLGFSGSSVVTPGMGGKLVGVLASGEFRIINSAFRS